MQMFCARHKRMKRMRFSAVTAVRKLGEDGFPVSQPLIDAWNETLAPVVCQGARGPSRTRVPTDLKSRGLMPTWLGSSEGIEVYLKVIGKALVMNCVLEFPVQWQTQTLCPFSGSRAKEKDGCICFPDGWFDVVWSAFLVESMSSCEWKIDCCISIWESWIEEWMDVVCGP